MGLILLAGVRPLTFSGREHDTCTALAPPGEGSGGSRGCLGTICNFQGLPRASGLSNGSPSPPVVVTGCYKHRGPKTCVSEGFPSPARPGPRRGLHSPVECVTTNVTPGGPPPQWWPRNPQTPHEVHMAVRVGRRGGQWSLGSWVPGSLGPSLLLTPLTFTTSPPRAATFLQIFWHNGTGASPSPRRPRGDSSPAAGDPPGLPHPVTEPGRAAQHWTSPSV
ncbi:hypothetical protein E2C01_084928 [Portunus trituberculatus]|uniref:Uncharacterized protein n=1 Tax=Portunus trituberculatus TaxID=210409 RepID=A0A5B7J5E6_PORTR|nr:hypothetical protein [Portunus trituberculatus]